MSPNPDLDPSNSFSRSYPRVFVKCKSEHVSLHCLQDKVPTYHHGITSLIWSLPSIPDPSPVTSTPPLPIPCHSSYKKIYCSQNTLPFSRLQAFACQCLSSWNAFPPVFHQANSYSSRKMQLKYLQLSQAPQAERIASLLCHSQALCILLLQPISQCIAIFCSLYLIFRILALQRQTQACCFLYALASTQQ